MIWIPLYVLAVYHLLYVCACVWEGGGESELSVVACCIIALCFSTYIPVVNITYYSVCVGGETNLGLFYRYITVKRVCSGRASSGSLQPC